MQSLILNLSTAHRYGPTFYDFLKLRKTHFVDALNWDIPHDDKVEMDQYDTPQAWYSCVTHNGKLIGGARIMPTSAQWGPHGYMLGDACKGLLPGIPQTALPYEIATPRVWECTRLVVCASVRDIAMRSHCLEMICNGLVEVALQHDAEELITLTRVSLMRTLRGLGFDVVKKGIPYRSPADGNLYAVLSMPAAFNHRAIAAE